jgi:hypothetical protein
MSSQRTETPAPVHHQTFHQATDQTWKTFRAACHDCDWSTTGTQRETTEERRDHETEAAVKVAAYWA